MLSLRIFCICACYCFKYETDIFWGALTDSLVCIFRDRPAAIQIEVKSIDDTSNFDEFPDIDLKWREFYCISQCCLALYVKKTI